MSYSFNLDTHKKIQSALRESTVVRENHFQNQQRSWDIIYFEFEKSVILEKSSPYDQDLVDLIELGDKVLTKQLKTLLVDRVSIEAGLRWRGCSETEKKIKARGIGLKIAYVDHKDREIIDLILDSTVKVLIQTELLDDVDSVVLRQNLNKALVSESIPIVSRARREIGFFTEAVIPVETESLTKKYLATWVPPVLPKYRRDDEKGINPVYQDLSTVQRALELNQKIIWLLRSDGVLAIGIKNSYSICFGEQELAISVPENLREFIDWDDRYGHPSLALPQENYDGSALYGGYLCQRNDYLQVFTSSGRYFRDDLSDKQKSVLEAYISLRFQQAYGEQDVVFFEGPYKDYYELSYFFSDRPLPRYLKNRRYTVESIENILDRLERSEKPQVPDLTRLLSNDKLFSRFVEQQRDPEDDVSSWAWHVLDPKNCW